MKLLSIDLDGTLFQSNAQPSRYNLDAVLQAKKNGVAVIINSGRPIQELQKYPQLLELHVPFICHNGSQIYNEDLELLYEITIDLEEVKQAILDTQHLGFSVRLQTNQGEFRGAETILALENVKAYKLVFQTDGEKERLYEVMNYMDKDHFTFAVESHKKKIEVTNFHASKGVALEQYQQLIHTHFDDVYAIGDGENDIAHFGAASFSVAMENAEPHIKEQADAITKTNNQHGVAYAIEHIFKLI